MIENDRGKPNPLFRLLSVSVDDCPEARLVCAVINEAARDLGNRDRATRRDAERFFEPDWRLQVWAGIVGLDAFWVADAAWALHYNRHGAILAA